jgi:UPF0716 family protein affecting phage T7 exclusion
LYRWERTIFIIAGILICIPESITDRIGFVLGGTLLVWLIVQRIRNKPQHAIV